MIPKLDSPYTLPSPRPVPLLVSRRGRRRAFQGAYGAKGKGRHTLRNCPLILDGVAEAVTLDLLILDLPYHRGHTTLLRLPLVFKGSYSLL